MLDGILLDGRTVDERVAALHTGSEETWSLSEADTFTLTLDLDIADDGRRLLRSRLLRERVTVEVDGIVYELAGIAKAGGIVTLTFEDADVAALRRALPGEALTVSGITRTQWAARLAKLVPGLEFRGEPGSPATRKWTKPKKVDPYERLQEVASERNWRCYIHRRTLWFGSDEWLTRQHEPVTLSETTRGVQNIDFDYDVAAEEASATVTANLTRWSLPPGRPVILTDLGPADGRWLVERRSRIPSEDPLVTLELRQREPALAESRRAPSTAGGDPSARGFAWPVGGAVASEFGMRVHPVTGQRRLHAGVDISASAGVAVVAAKAGRVSRHNDPDGYGLWVAVDHGNGQATRYAHLSRYAAGSGARVARGDVIGYVGATGNATGAHLHFEVRVNGSPVNPRDYLP